MVLVEVTHKCGHVLGTFSNESEGFEISCPKCKNVIMFTNHDLNVLESDNYTLIRFVHKDDTLARKIFEALHEYWDDHSEYYKDLDKHIIPKIRDVIMKERNND